MAHSSHPFLDKYFEYVKFEIPIKIETSKLTVKIFEFREVRVGNANLGVIGDRDLQGHWHKDSTEIMGLNQILREKSIENKNLAQDWVLERLHLEIGGGKEPAKQIKWQPLDMKEIWCPETKRSGFKNKVVVNCVRYEVC